MRWQRFPHIYWPYAFPVFQMACCFLPNFFIMVVSFFFKCSENSLNIPCVISVAHKSWQNFPMTRRGPIRKETVLGAVVSSVSRKEGKPESRRSLILPREEAAPGQLPGVGSHRARGCASRQYGNTVTACTHWM